MKKITAHFQYQANMWYLIFVLTAYSLVTSILLLRSKPETKIIALEPTGTRIISDAKDLVLEKEEIDFVKKFIYLYTNFDATNFSDHPGHATDWLADEAWKKLESSYAHTKAQVLELHISQFSEITKLEQSDTNKHEYTVELKSTQSYRGIQKKLIGHIGIFIKPKIRSDINPWGWQVENLSESWKELAQ